MGDMLTVDAQPVRIQRKRTKGWKMPPNTVSVTRPSIWGNPFTYPSVEAPDAAAAVALYREALLNTWHSLYYGAKTQLRGKNLACFCPLDQPCHADVLLEIANADSR